MLAAVIITYPAKSNSSEGKLLNFANGRSRRKETMFVDKVKSACN